MVQLTASSSLNFLNSLIVCLRDYFCNVPQRWRRETRVFCSTPGTAASPDRVVRRRREACRYLCSLTPQRWSSRFLCRRTSRPATGKSDARRYDRPDLFPDEDRYQCGGSDSHRRRETGLIASDQRIPSRVQRYEDLCWRHGPTPGTNPGGSRDHRPSSFYSHLRLQLRR
jgi:hypothetical protein